jgi:hypothetical protein
MSTNTTRPDDIDQHRLENDKVDVDEEKTVTASKEDIVKHYRRNLERKNTLYTPRSMKLVGDELKPKVDRRDDGAYFPDTPHPVFRKPRGFIKGAGRDEDHAAYMTLPSRHEQINLVRENEDLTREDDGEEFNEKVGEYYEYAVEEWESQARQLLKEEVVVTDGEKDILLKIEYED